MLLVDSFEPEELLELMQQSIPVERHSLNQYGQADYLWVDAAGKTRQIERKQWGELLSSLDAVEIQLRKELPLTDSTDLLIEGIVNASPYGLDAYVWDSYKMSYRFTHSFGDANNPQRGLYAKVMAWLWVLEKMGVTTWMTPSLTATAQAIVAFYQNSQKLSHSTLNRYLKPKTGLRNLDPQVLSLMGIENAKLGPKRAEALIEKFQTVYNVLTADGRELEKVDGFGKKGVERLFKSIGRSM